MIARMTLIRINTTIRRRMIRTCFFSSIFLMILPFRKSSVRVELEASTSDESVDIEAERTRMTMTPIRKGESVSSIVGTTES